MDLSAKFVGILHAIRLECSSWSMVSQVVNSLLQMVTDYGTESMLTQVPKFDVRSIFADWRDDVLVDDDPAMELVEMLSPANFVSFERAMATPGVEHIAHNSLDQVGGKLKHFKRWWKLASEFSKYFGSLYSAVFQNDSEGWQCFRRIESLSADSSEGSGLVEDGSVSE